MRNALGLMVGDVVSAALIAAVWFWTSSPRAELAAAPATVKAAQAERLPASAKPADDVAATGSIAAKPAVAAAAPAAPAATMVAQPTGAPCANPDALGVSRVVEVDTTGGPGFGFEHFKQLDFLTDKEVVLTFDDGPWPGNTPAVLKALADQCTKAVFFSIGKHAGYPSRNSPAGLCRRSYRRHPHLVACQPQQQEAERAAGQGRDRKGF